MVSFLSPTEYKTLFGTVGEPINPAAWEWYNKQVGNNHCPIVKLDQLQWTTGLPKTRSGKIMRRILRKIANNDLKEGLGDTSTLANPEVIEHLL